MDPVLRHWWRLLEDLPGHVTRVHRWTTPQRRPPAEGTFHAVPTLVCCLEGVVRARMGGRRALDLGAGEVLLIAGGVWHEHASLRPGSVWFGQGFMAAWSDVSIGTAGRTWSGKLPAEPSRQLMESALEAADEAGAVRGVKALVAQVLAESVTDLSLDRPALRAMVDQLWRRCHHGVTVDELVAASGLKRAQAYAVFTAGYGVTPRQAIATTRLWLAGSYLQSGLPVAEVARLAGYPSADTFSRCWRREYGKPPRESR